MAERRMFAKTIIDSDAFLDMPLSTQSLYFHLNMRADDDGFVNNPKKIQRMIGCSDDDIKLLIAKQFIIHFENGVIVIKHWKMHNYLRVDRYKPTVYQEEKALISEKENKSYTLCLPDGIPDGNQLETQVRLGKDSIGKVSIDKDYVQEEKPKQQRFTKPTIEDIAEYCKERKNNIDPNYFFDYYKSKGWMVGKTPMKDWKATVRNWNRNQEKKPKSSNPFLDMLKEEAHGQNRNEEDPFGL